MTDINESSALTWVQKGLGVKGKRLMDSFPMDPLTTFFPEAETADEVMLSCSLSTLILWMRALQEDLAILLEEAAHPLGEASYHAILARILRCVAVDHLLVLQGEMVYSTLRHPGADIRFHLLHHNARNFQTYSLVGLLTLNLERLVPQLEASYPEEMEQKLPWQPLKEAMLLHLDRFSVVQHQVNELITRLCEHQAPRSVHLDELVLSDLISSLEHESSPGDVPLREDSRPENNEVLWGIIVLHTLEIWLSAFSIAGQEAMHQLQAAPMHIGKAEHLIRRMATLMHFFTYMLRMPLEASPSHLDRGNRRGLVFDPQERMPDGILPCSRTLLYACAKQVLFPQGGAALDDDWFDMLAKVMQEPVADEHMSSAALADALQELDLCERRWWSVAGPLWAST